jgi:hypothetical protein
MLHIKMAPGEEEDAWVVLWRLQSGKVVVLHTSGRPLKIKSTKGASSNLNSATTEQGTKVKDFCVGKSPSSQ